MRPIIDMFAGPGGWDEGLASLGVRSVLGIEKDGDACETAMNAGHARAHDDLTTVAPSQYAGADGLIASPPCQDYSSAGRRGESGTAELVHTVLPWVRAIAPRWVACEQVRAVLPLWHQLASELERHGYKTTTALLDAANYGVPQHRIRAVLLASRDYRPQWPASTHGGALWGKPYLTMRDALGWQGELDRRQQQGPPEARERVPAVPTDRPAPTITGAALNGQWLYTPLGGEARHVRLEEGAVLQGFRPNYPWSGDTKKSKAQQIGNAVPPPMAAALVNQFVTADAVDAVA